MADSNIKLRDRIVSGVLALLIPILGLNIGSSFNSAEAVSYNDESTNNLSVAQHSAENTDNKITLTLNAITKGKSSNIPVPNTVFKYKVYADIDKKNLISDEKVAYSGSNGQAKIELDDNGTVYVDIVSADAYGYSSSDIDMVEVQSNTVSNIMLYKDKGAYYSISLEELISESSATKNVVDSSNFENNSILVKHYITNENGKLVLDERGSKYMRYTEGLNKYTTELYQNEIYEFTLTSSEYQTQTVVYNNLNPDNIEVAESSLTGNIDNFKGKKVYEIRPITVEKLLGNESLRLAYRLENGKEAEFSSALDMIYSHSMDIYVKPDNSNSEYLSNITATSSNEKIVSVVKNGSYINLNANSVGEATINVMVPYDGKYKKSELSFKVTVKKKEIGNDKVTLLGIPQNPKVNSKSKLDVSVSTSENIGKITKTYSILNVIKLDGSEVKEESYDNYVRIDNDGNFTFLKACKFKAEVNVTSENSNIIFAPVKTGIITINKAILSLNFEKENLSIKYGEKAENKLNGFNSEYGTLTYSSSDSKVASVDTNGNVTGNDIGKATITAALDSESYVFGYDSDGREINEASYSVEVGKADQDISYSNKMIEIVNYGDEIEISPTWFSGIQENATLLNAEIEENDYVELSENRIIVKKAGDNAQFNIRFNFDETRHYNKFTTRYFTVTVKRGNRSIDIFAGNKKITGHTLELNYGEQKQYQLSYALPKEEDVDVNVSYNIYKLHNGVYEKLIGEGKTSIDNTGLIKFADKDIGQYKVTIKNAQGECYNESNAEAYINLDIAKSDSLYCNYSKTDYNDWYNTTNGVTITPPEGYKISDNMSIGDSNWKDEYVYTNNGKNQHIQFYVRNNENGIVYSVEKENINIDNTKPYNLDISYKSEKNVYNTILDYITFGLVSSRDTNIEVTLSAYEDISGIKSFSYELIPEAGRELDIENKVSKNVILDNIETAIDDNGKTYYKASFKIEAEFRGDIKFTAKSKAGLETEYDKNAKVIVDNRKPDVDIKLNSEAVATNGQYYNKSVVANISISESNFDADKVDILINGQKLSESGYKLENDEWVKNGNTAKITWTNSIKFSEDGVYNISVIASDELGQVSDEKTSSFVIDETKPIISVDYFSDSPAVNEKFYTTKIRAKVSVDEVNFRADDIIFELKAQDVTLNNISDYETVLKELNDTLHNGEWISDGNNHYIEIEFNADANYSFTLNYTDLAGNDAEEKYNSPDFTIDQTPPTNLNAKYSEEKNFFEEIIDNITFITYYYKDNVTITFSADDMTSGIDSIDWEYQRQVGSSDSSVADVSKHFKKEDITFSEDGKTGEVTVELSAEESKQYRGTISFTVTDMAGKTATYPVENKDERITVVDNISPTRSVEYQTNNFVKSIYAESFKNATYDMKSDANNYRLYYKDDATLKFTVKEANFFSEDINLYDNGKSIDFSENWQQNGDEYTNTLTLRDEGEHIIKMTYTDRSTNEMKSYESNVIIIDRTKPVIDVQYSPEDKISDANKNVYCNKQQTATIKITERNFRADDVAVTVSAKDAGGNNIKVTDYAAYLSSRDSWKKNGDTYTATIKYSVNANYTFDISYSDLASHSAGNYKQDKFTVDEYAPATSKMKISYSKELNFWESVLNGITFGYYAYQKDITVTLTAVDDISGVESMTWTYTRENGASTTKNLKSDGGTINRENMTITSDKKTATAKFTLTADQSKQYRGKISFTAIDRSGNTSNVKYDSKNSILIVDNISPTRSVEFSKADRIVTASDMNDVSNYNYGTEGNLYKLYYKDSATATIKITEANFYSEDVNIEVNGSKQKLNNWKQNGDTWTGSLTLSKEGEYIIKISYIDRSNNKMKTYTSNEIIVDHTNPVINVAYSPNKVVNTANGIKYYNSAQIATISVIERNFRADEIAANITAVDVNGKAVGVENYAQYLSKRSNWIKNGDVYTANIKYSTDANYTFKIEYEDLAGRKVQNNVEDKFTVDKTAPKNLRISYSQNVFQNVLNSITFGYYNAPVTVTISAEDDTTAIGKFVYSYLKDNNSSNVNAQLLNEAISRADIKRNGNVNTATFKIPKSVLDAQHQYNGTVKFTAYDMSQNDSDKSDTKKIIVDNIKPEIDVTLNKPISTADGTAYYDGKIDATLKINEANFYSEDVRVMVYDINAERTLNPSVSWTDNSSDLHTGTFSIDKDGKYRIEVEYTDRSKNKMNNYTSDYLVIDTKKPSLKVTNIKNNTANKDKTYGFTIEASDTNIDYNSFKPVLEALMMTSSGQFTRESIDLSKYLRKNSSTSYSYVVDNLSDDAVYTLSCSVADMSGNKTDKILLDDGKTYDNAEFSINRNGSTFKIDENTQKLLDNYYVSSVDNDIVIQEINVDPIENYVVKLNGTALKENEGYTSSETTDASKWCERKYVISSSLFENESDYDIKIESTDKAGSVAYSDLKGLEVKFVVDKTPPTLIVSGIEDNGRYQVQEQKVTVIPSDNGGKLGSLRIVILDSNGKEINVLFNKSGEDLLKYLSSNNGKVEFNIPEGFENQVVFYCDDCSVGSNGQFNENKKIISNITVSPNNFVIFYANKPMFYSVTIGGSVLIIGIIAAIVLIVRRKIRKRISQ